MHKILDKCGDNFKNHVNKYREDKFDKNELDKIFSADLVLGETAIELGLIDEIGMFDEVMAEKHKDLEVKNFSKRSPFDSFAESFDLEARARMQQVLMKKLMRTNI